MTPGFKQKYPCGCEARLGTESISLIRCAVHEAAPDLLDACRTALEACDPQDLQTKRILRDAIEEAKVKP